MASIKPKADLAPPDAGPVNGTAPARRLRLTPAWAGRDVSLEEFVHAIGKEGWRYELIDGRVEVSPTPELPHDCVLEWLADRLRAYRDAHTEIINKISTHARVYVPGRRSATCPEPDLAAYRDFPTRWPRQIQSWQDVHPILVVEVISPRYANKDLVRNVALYREIPSVREYWILDARDRDGRFTMRVYRKRGGRSWLRPIDVPFAGTYETPLLPGFSLVVDPNV